ncbi:hypothetical protein HO133_005864 [Letharia lupina]|uniref:F-box domain-containing protein n=1 Tax=Letharia lupina TaxID=560253 RepID=A0A8H6C7Y1_9LECA|nr:uncharacterized protein HO133_005864 [Letharia lupina]KAF6218515.1 hypothetical protein HO133_005864 [Letharia lupina]
MPASIKDVPPEIFENILSHIRPVDYLKVKLVSKSFSDWASNVFKWEDMTMEEVVQGHTSVEASLPRGRPLNYCVCKHCGLVKPTNEFSDNQAVKTNHKRICISCGIGYNTYTKRQLPKINGEEHIPCWHCRKAVPKYDNWEEILVSGKAVLTKLLEETTPEGDPITYMTSDRYLGPKKKQKKLFTEFDNLQEEWKSIYCRSNTGLNVTNKALQTRSSMTAGAQQKLLVLRVNFEREIQRIEDWVLTSEAIKIIAQIRALEKQAVKKEDKA